MEGDGRSGKMRVLRLVLGLLAVLAGAALTLKPYSSLDALTIFLAAALVITGIGELFAEGGGERRWPRWLFGLALIAVGVLAVALPGLTIASIALIVGIGLIVAGLSRLYEALRQPGERLIDLLAGMGMAILGTLALSWPDATILLVGLVTGPVAVVIGAIQIYRAIRGTPGEDGATKPGRYRGLRTAGAAAAFGLAALLAVASLLIHGKAPGHDDFYDPPSPLPGGPGELIRSETVEPGLAPDAVTMKILYTTTSLDGKVIPASGLVVLPDGITDAPVLLWEHGTTGVDERCAPSNLAEPFEAGGMPVVAQVPKRGWALVAPDYPGLGAPGGHPYLVGVPEARSALDAVRAARHVPDASLGSRTVVWGHSQGGGAALWTAVEQPSYAKDVPLAGVAALAPASDVPALASAMLTNPAGMFFATLVLRGYDNAYDDIRMDDYVRPAAREIVKQVVSRCLSEPAELLSLPPVMTGQSIFSRDMTSGALGRRLRENVPLGESEAPILIGQGLKDGLVLPAMQGRYVRRMKRMNPSLRYVPVAGRDHLTVVAADSPLLPRLYRWTRDRFDDE